MKVEFRPVYKTDHQALGGIAVCNSDNPLIAEVDKLTFIVDGATVKVLELVYNEEDFTQLCYARGFGNAVEAQQVAIDLLVAFQVVQPFDTFKALLCAALSKPQEY